MTVIVLGLFQTVVACSGGSDYGSDQSDQPNQSDWVPQPTYSDECNFGCW